MPNADRLLTKKTAVLKNNRWFNKIIKLFTVEVLYLEFRCPL